MLEFKIILMLNPKSSNLRSFLQADMPDPLCVIQKTERTPITALNCIILAVIVCTDLDDVFSY